MIAVVRQGADSRCMARRKPDTALARETSPPTPRRTSATRWTTAGHIRPRIMTHTLRHTSESPCLPDPRPRPRTRTDRSHRGTNIERDHYDDIDVTGVACAPEARHRWRRHLAWRACAAPALERWAQRHARNHACLGYRRRQAETCHCPSQCRRDRCPYRLCGPRLLDHARAGARCVDTPRA